jgi:hypothetical protein
MESRYYTPSIEEFHVGFEYECFYKTYSHEWDLEGTLSWKKLTVEDLNTAKYINDKDYRPIYHVSVFNNGQPIPEWNKNIRVKYLDKDDIEELGWDDSDGMYSLVSGGIKYYLLIYESQDKIEIRCSESSVMYGGFYGHIKNKSELKRIMKQVGI